MSGTRHIVVGSGSRWSVWQNCLRPSINLRCLHLQSRCSVSEDPSSLEGSRGTDKPLSSEIKSRPGSSETEPLGSRCENVLMCCATLQAILWRTFMAALEIGGKAMSNEVTIVNTRVLAVEVWSSNVCALSRTILCSALRSNVFDTTSVQDLPRYLPSV